MSLHNTAILLFARSGIIDAQTKGIPGGERVFDTLTFQTFLKAKRTGLPCYHIGEKDQRGDGFSERFSNAIHKVLENGIQNLIVIGNDSPDLTTRDLIFAARSLESGKPVLGPSSDGGVYLIGFHHSHFKKDSFQALPWNTSSLYKHLQGYFKANAQNIPFVLKSRIDLDTTGDLYAWVSGVRWSGNRIVRLIRGLLRGGYENLIPETSLPKIYPSAHFNKGSPLPEGLPCIV